MLKKILAALAALGAGLSTVLFMLLKLDKEKRKVQEAEEKAAAAERRADVQESARHAEAAVAKKRKELEAEDAKLNERVLSGDTLDGFSAGLDLLRKQSERGDKRNTRAGGDRT